MRHLLKLSSIVTAIALAAVAPREASAQTKEGTYKGTYAANGNFKATAIGKDRVLLVFDEYGMGVTDGFLDHFTWHCWGTGDYTNGMGEDHGFCVGTGPEGDEIVSNITNPMHALGAKDASGTDNWTTGSGKLAGVSGGGTYDCQSGEFKTTVPGTYVAYCSVQGKYKLP